MNASPWLIAVAASGLLMCFLGYRAFRIVLVLVGAGLGAGLGQTVGALVDSGAGPLVGAVLGAVLFALVAIFLFRVGVSLFAGSLFAATGAILLAPAGTVAQTIGAVVLGMVGAIVGIVVQRATIIFGTAAYGSLSTLVAGVLLMSGGAGEESQEGFGALVERAARPAALLDRPLLLVVWFALALAGILVQLSRSRKAEDGSPADP